MLRHLTLIVAIIALGNLSLKAQEPPPAQPSKTQKSLDLNIGLGILSPLYAPVPITIVYEQSIKQGFSWMVFSQLGIMSRTHEYLNMNYRIVNWIEGAGIGGVLGNKIIQAGLHAVVGGRYYYSKYTAENSNVYQEPSITTQKLMPELGLLLNIKVGKKKFYFNTQLYASMYPFGNWLENFHNYSFGAGYRF